MDAFNLKLPGLQYLLTPRPSCLMLLSMHQYEACVPSKSGKRRFDSFLSSPRTKKALLAILALGGARVSLSCVNACCFVFQPADLLVRGAEHRHRAGAKAIEPVFRGIEGTSHYGCNVAPICGASAPCGPHVLFLWL